MGRLTVTAIATPEQRNHQAVINEQTIQAGEDVVFATITIRKRDKLTNWFEQGIERYTYKISGVPLAAIDDIPSIVPCLERIIEQQREKPKQYVDPEYNVVRELTFSSKDGQKTAPRVIAGSARALNNFLSTPSDAKTLVINNYTHTYCPQQIETDKNHFTLNPAGLTRLLSTFPAVKPIHFPHLTAVQLLITIDIQVAIDGLTNLLQRQCLPALKRLELPFSGHGQASISKKGTKKEWLGMDTKESNALYRLYEYGLPNAPQLDRLHLTLWCADATQAGLRAIKMQPQLKNLEIDLVTPTAVSVGERKVWENHHNLTYVSPTAYGTMTSHMHYTDVGYSTEIRIPSEEEVAHHPTVLSVLEELQESSEIEQLIVRDWGEKNIPRPEQPILQAAIELGYLPKLNSLTASLTVALHTVTSVPVADRPLTDSRGLLQAVLARQVPLQNLWLIRIEKYGYQPWLDAMKEGCFPLLSKLHYRLPDQQMGEKDKDHHARVTQALTTLYDAILLGKLPQLHTFIIDGEQIPVVRGRASWPAHLDEMVKNIDAAIAAQQSNAMAVS